MSTAADKESNSPQADTQPQFVKQFSSFDNGQELATESTSPQSLEKEVTAPVPAKSEESIVSTAADKESNSLQAHTQPQLVKKNSSFDNGQELATESTSPQSLEKEAIAGASFHDIDLSKPDPAKFYKDYSKDTQSFVQSLFLTKDNLHETETVQQYSGLDLTLHQFQTIKPKAWFCDEVINMYGSLLKENHCNDNIGILLSSFGNLIYDDGKPYNFQTVKRWTTDKQHRPKVSTFSIIHIPVCLHNHWVLFTLERNSSDGSGDLCIVNSCHGYENGVFEDVAQRIQQFAIDSKLCSSPPRIRNKGRACQQQNGYDCGLFTINFLRKAVFRPNDPFPSEGFQYSRMNLAMDLLNLNVSTSIV